jgi:hypothetical protein
MNKIIIIITLLLATTLMHGQKMEFGFMPVSDGRNSWSQPVLLKNPIRIN